MPSQLIFITGATGFIGAATALAALQAGYRLRVSVRKDEQIEKLKKLFSDYKDKLEYVIVPNITAPNAFAEVLDDVDYILHLASPLAGKLEKNAMFNAAREGTLSILRDAAKAPSVKKVVITSSIAALQPLKGVPEGGVVKEVTGWDLSVDTEANFETGNEQLTSFQIYRASKLLANEASWKFIEKEKPAFALVTLHPSLVYGHNPIQQSAKELEQGSNGLLFGSIINGAFSDTALQSVYIGDVANSHIKALDPKIKSGSSYLIAGKPYTWKDVVDTVQKYYPNVPYKLIPSTERNIAKTDTTKAETELGIKWVEPEKMIKEVLDQQLGFLS